jgi:hypothetical protein
VSQAGFGHTGFGWVGSVGPLHCNQHLNKFNLIQKETQLEIMKFFHHKTRQKNADKHQNPMKGSDRFHILSDRFRILSDRFHILSGRFRILSDRFHILSDRFRIFSDRFYILSDRFRILSDRFHILSGRFRILSDGFRILSDMFHIPSK